MKVLTFAVAALGVATIGWLPSSLSAQGNDPTPVIAGGGVTLPGWTGRIDPQAARGGKKLTDDKVIAMGTGFHVTSGPAAIYWNPKNTASGNYKVTASFTQMKPATHPEAYGLIIGGNDLDSPNQHYLYFLVRQDGKYLINHRANDSTVHKMIDWKQNDAVKRVDSHGRATNVLSVVVAPEKLSFRANGVELTSLPRSSVDRDGPGSGTTGVVGVRVNHNLDVHIDGFAATPAK